MRQANRNSGGGFRLAATLNNNAVFVTIVVVLVLLILGFFSGMLSLSVSSPSSEIGAALSPPQQHRRPVKPAPLKLEAARQQHQHQQRVSLQRPAFPFEPPTRCMDELDRGVLPSKYLRPLQNQSGQVSSLSSSAHFRLIPRSDSSGQDVHVLRNATIAQCVRLCVQVGPRRCSFVVREMLPDSLKKSRFALRAADRSAFRTEALMFGAADDGDDDGDGVKGGGGADQQPTTPSPSTILHPRQAANDYLFSTFADEERSVLRDQRALNASDRALSSSPPSQRQHELTTCYLRVGLLDVFPDPQREVWVPSVLQERTEIGVRPGALSWTTGRFDDSCRADAALPPMAGDDDDGGGNNNKAAALKRPTHSIGSNKNSNVRSAALPSVSSLVAIGLLAGAPYLQERVLPALSSWLKHEPNVVAFVDRKPSAIRTVKDVFLRRHPMDVGRGGPGEHHQQQQHPEGAAASSSSSASVPRFRVVPTRLNPLFACVSMAQLNQLYREYPEHGGDAAFPEDWDPELTHDTDGDPSSADLPPNLEQPASGSTNGAGNGTSPPLLPFPFFCNPASDLEIRGLRKFLYKRPTVPGITHPIPIAHVINSAARSTSSSSRASSAGSNDGGQAATEFVVPEGGGAGEAAATPAGYVDIDPELLAEEQAAVRSERQSEQQQRQQKQKVTNAAGTHPTISALGYVLFRFIREPHHEVLRQYNGAWKNFLMLFELPLFYPSASWYVYVDDDTLVLWRNFRYILLLASVSGLHRRADIYGGYMEHGSTIFFVHGGSGMIVSHGTLWRAHRRLPGCLAVCRQFYGDTRTGCCFHGADIYERRLRFIWPYKLEAAPEMWTGLLSSVHKYRTREEILGTYAKLELELARKKAAQSLELDRSVRLWWQRRQSQAQRGVGSASFEQKVRMWLDAGPVAGLRQRAFAARQREARRYRWALDARYHDVAPEDRYMCGTMRWEELLFTFETYRICTAPWKKDWFG